MAESDVPDNLTFLLGSDPVEGAEPPAEDEAAHESAPAEVQPGAAPQEAVAAAPAPEDEWRAQAEREKRGILNELRDTRQELRAYREAERARQEEIRAREQEEWNRQNAPVEPDKDADPAAWLAYQNRLAIWEVEQQRQQEQQAAYAQQEAAEVRDRFFGTVDALEQQFRAERPDYDQAVDYCKQLRAQELAGFGLSQDQIEHQLRKELLGFSALYLGNGTSPAQAAYNYALTRGYRPPQAAQPAPAPQPSSYPVPAPQRLHTSLSTAPGGAGGGRGVTLENLHLQPTAVQNAAMDSPEMWERLNMGETIYP